MALFGNKDKKDTRQVIANEMIKKEDGTMEVTITFDPFYHGHDLGSKRNYNVDKYRAMVENNSTQARIANGYAVGYYSHDSRSRKKGYVAAERDDNGNEVIPCCKTLKMEWVEGENKVRHTQRILNNKIGKEIQKLIENGVGGFSSVHNLSNGSFYGFDYVISPNFSSNRAVVDNICENGVCSIDADSIKTEIEDTLRDEIESYLMSIGVDSIEARDALLYLEEHRDSFIANNKAIKALEKAKIEHQEQLDAITIQKDLELQQKDIELDELRDEIERLKAEIDNIKYDYKVKLDSLGLDDNLNPADWGDFVKHITTDEVITQQMDTLKKNNLKMPNKQKQMSHFNFSNMSWKR